MSSKRIFTEHGQVLVLVAISAIVLLGFTALAIDGSAKLSDRRHAQNAADTAANAAALAKVNAMVDATKSKTPTNCPAATMPYSDVCNLLLQAGKDRAASNGYNNDIVNNTVEVYSPPISGYYSTVANKDKYVQVIITSKVKTTFGRVLGLSQTVNVVQAVAYAKEGSVIGDGAMIVSYDPDPNCSVGGTGGYSVSVSGNSIVNLNGGGIYINSDETCGFTIPNCADLNVISGSINTVGNNINTTGCTFDPPLKSNINQAPIAIPDDVYWPDVPSECGYPASAYNKPLGSDTWHITPGYYTSFPQSTINGDIVGTKKNIVMDPGVYCVGGDIHWSGNTFNSLNGSSGVTIYMKDGHDFSLSINSPIVLTAPTSGNYQGYLIIQEGTHTDIEDCVINGGAYLAITGLIYAPYCNITVNGKAGETADVNAQLVGWDIKINGSNKINFTYNPAYKVVTKRRIGLMK